MESEHIDNRRLYDLIKEQAILNQSEVEHLKTCEECLELIRVLIRQQMAKGATP
jgi:hypothetical protein